MSASDEELFRRYRQGQQEAFAEIVSRHAGQLLGYLTKMLNNASEAEDVFQECFKKVCLKAEEYDDSKPFKPWLYRIATNLAIDAIRKRQRKPTEISMNSPLNETESDMVLEQTIEDNQANPAEQLDLLDRKNLVRQAVDELPDSQRATLLMAYFHKMPYKDIAEAMNISVGTVKTHMSRAMRALAKRFPDPEVLEANVHPVKGAES